MNTNGLIAEVRRMSGVGIEELSDFRVERLLQAHDSNVAQAAASVCKHIELARSFDSNAALWVGQQTSVELGSEVVVVKNTFLHVDTKPLLRRRRSFAEFGTNAAGSNSSNDTVCIGGASKNNSREELMFVLELSGFQTCLPMDRQVDHKSLELASTASNAGSYVDSYESSAGSGDEDRDASPVQEKVSCGPTVERPNEPVWSPELKLNGKRRKSGWTRQRRSKALVKLAAAPISTMGAGELNATTKLSLASLI